jgi:hypothetical protein
MAHRGLIDLVTSDAERVTGRSIDLKLDWTTIVAAAVPGVVKITTAKLLEWAKLICGNEAIASTSNADDRALILEAFVEIAAQWERRDPLRALESVPDCDLNTNIWRHLHKSWEAYSAMVASVNEALNGNISIEECIENISESFLSRPEMFHRSRTSIIAIEDFARSRPEINRIANYLALTDATNDSDVERAKAELRQAIREASEQPTEQSRRDIGYRWDKFLRLYTEYYQNAHARLSEVIDGRRSAGRRLNVTDSEVSESLGTEDPFENKRRLRRIKRQLDRTKCSLDPTPFLQSTPFCRCGFQPSGSSSLVDLDTFVSPSQSQSPQDSKNYSPLIQSTQ